MKKLFISAFMVMIFLITLGGLSSAAVWDFTDDYTTSSNPNDAWSYGWEQTLGGTFNLYDAVNGTQWYASTHHSGDLTPAVWKNTGGGTSYGVAPGETSLHPGWDYSLSVMRWTAPSAGEISLDGYFGAGDWGAMSYYILLNGVVIFEKFNDSNTETFSLSGISVSSGSTLDFAVGVGNSGYGYGNTPFDVTITSSAVPIPGALWLLGSGLLGLVGLRRKFRQ